MLHESKGMTISVRISKEVADSFDKLSKLMQINKSDFLRVCIEKLCKDNQLYLEHTYKEKEYIEMIKVAMSKISPEKIIVENGSWETVKDVAILMLCDLLFKYSEVFDTWFGILVDYGLLDKNSKGTLREEFSEGLIQLEDIGFILSPTRGPADVEELIIQDFWWDELETKRISLLLATKTAIEMSSAEAIISEVVARTSKIEREPTIIVLDAQGKFKRSGAVIITPAEWEKVSKRKN